MQNTPTLTKRQWYLNIETENELTRLRFHIEAKAKKRIEQFWNKNINWLENKFDDLFKLKDPNQFKNFLARIVTKQVLSMAEYDKVYKITDGEMITDDDKIEELIEISLYIPELFSSIHNRDKKKLKQLTQKMTIVLAKSKSENKIYKKALEDKQEKDRMSLDRIISYYIEACRVNTTDKPTREMLSTVSGLSQNHWKHILANSKFLYPLAKSLEEQMKLSKNEIEFWRGAKIVIEKKLARVLYRIKPPKTEPEIRSSKQKQIKGKTIKSDSEEQFESSHQCKYCDKIIPIEQELCKDCKELFPSN